MYRSSMFLLTKSLLFTVIFKISALLRPIPYLFFKQVAIGKKTTVGHVLRSYKSGRAMVTASCTEISRCVL